MNSINLEEFKEIFNYLIENNRRLQDEGKKTSSVGLEGPAGIGKTAIIEQIANERGMTFIKLNLSQLEEIGDLIGFPLKQFKMILHSENGDKEAWVSHDLLQTYLTAPCETYTLTNETRMSYAPPEWLPKEENPNGTILLLDDYSRATQYFIQATMELIDKGEYISWKLPQYTTVVLSSNPDDGEYSVSTMDNAQKTRYINFNVEFNLDAWARWAEKSQLDNRTINFALSYGHEIFETKEGIQKVNARSYVTFANAISGIENWSEPKSLAMILNISKGCFTDKDNIIGHLFTTFIANKLDKLVSPEDMLLKPWNVIKSQIKKCVYDENGNYRPDIASVLHTRLLNYSMYYFSQPKAKTDVVQDRLLELIDASEDKDEMLFDEDLLFNIIRTLMKHYPARTNKFMLNKKIRDKVK